MSGFSINSFQLSGNLTSDPELRSLPSGNSVCKVRLANNSRRKDNATGEWVDDPGYYDITIWGGMGEWVAKNLNKGSGCAFAGRIKWREWENQEGQKRQAVEFVADSIFPQRDGDGGGGSRTPRSDIPEPAPNDFAPVAATAGPPTTGAQTPPDDDIPF